jgi:hypothetical protein
MAEPRLPVFRIRNDYAVTPVTTGAWVQLAASIPRANSMEVFDSSGRIMEISFGAVGAESASIFPMFITPGGNNNPIRILFGEGMRISIRAVDNNATAGQIAITFYY